MNPTGTVSSGTVTFEGSNDNAAFFSLPVYDLVNMTANTVTSFGPTTGVVRNFGGPLNVRYLRARISTVIGGGGSLQAFTRLSQPAFNTAQLVITQQTAANLNATVTATNLSTNIAQVGGTNTVTGGVAGIIAVGGNVAHSAAVTSNPITVGGVVTTTLDTTLVNGDVSRAMMTDAGQLIEKQFGSAGNDWSATSGLTPLATTSSTALKAAGAASIRNYCTAIQIQNTSATVTTTVTILDGVTVLWACNLPAVTTTGEINPITIVFPTPLRGTAATAMNIQLGTVSASVYYNVQGYQSF